ncbi:MAG: aminotransferase class IV [Mariprofundus sp.]|nr:aminotransferase class IV [Mariprofundus sp.]
MKIVSVDQMDRGLAYAESCFETFRVIDGVVFDWAGHWQRLMTGLFEFGVSFSEEKSEQIRVACLVEAEKTGIDSLLRLTVTAGEAGWGLLSKAVEPLVYIQSMRYCSDHAPIRLRLKSWPFPLKEKYAKYSGDYAETSRLLQGEKDVHLLFEQHGMLMAAATANILLFRDGAWHTPVAGMGVLAGRVRDFFIRKGLVNENPCPLSWLDDCEAAVVCNSGMFITSVADIAGIQRLHPMHTEHAAIVLLRETLRQEEGVQI